jgi:hypothetical protein
MEFKLLQMANDLVAAVKFPRKSVVGGFRAGRRSRAQMFWMLTLRLKV